MFKKIIDRFTQNRLTNKVKSVFLIFSTALTVFLPTVVFAQAVAEPSTWQKFMDGAKSFLFQGGAMATALNLVAGAVGGMLLGLNEIMIMIIEQAIGPALENLFNGESAIIHDMWRVVLDIANVFFFLALLIFSILIIVRYNGHNLKKAIIALITAAVIANISFPIAQILIFDLGDALADAARSIFGYSINDIANFFSKSWVTSFSAAFNPNVPSGAKLLYPILIIVTQIILAMTLFKLAFILAERAVRLVYLTIAAPLFFALSLLPSKDLEGMASQWWSDMIKWILVLPITLALISAAMKFYFAYFDSVDITKELTNQITGTGVVDESFWANFIIFILVISLLLAAGTADKMVGVTMTSAGAAGWLGFAGAGGKAIGGWAKGALGTQASRGLERLEDANKFTKGIGKRVRGVQNYFDKQKAVREAETIRRKNAVAAVGNEQNITIYNNLSETKDKKIAAIKATLPKSEHYKAEDMFKEQNPALANKLDTYDQLTTGYVSGARELQEKIGFDPETIQKQMEKLITQISSGDKSQGTRDKLVGLSAHLDKEASKGGVASIAYKAIANGFKADPHNNETIKKAGNKFWKEDAYPISEEQLRKHEAQQTNKVSDEDYTDLAIGINELKDAQKEVAKLKSDLASIDDNTKTGIGSLENISETKRTALQNATEDEAKTKLGQITNKGIDTVNTSIDDNTKTEIDVIQKSDKTSTEKKRLIQAKLVSTVRNDGSTESKKTFENISDLIVDHKIGLGDMKSAKALSTASDGDKTKVKQYLSVETKRQTTQLKVNRLKEKIVKSNKRTPTYTKVVKEAEIKGTYNPEVQKQLRSMSDRLQTSFANSVSDNKDLKASKMSAEQLGAEFDIMAEETFNALSNAGVKIFNKGEIIKTKEGLGQLSVERLLSEINRTIDAGDNLNNPDINGEEDA